MGPTDRQLTEGVIYRHGGGRLGARLRRAGVGAEVELTRRSEGTRLRAGGLSPSRPGASRESTVWGHGGAKARARGKPALWLGRPEPARLLLLLWRLLRLLLRWEAALWPEARGERLLLLWGGAVGREDRLSKRVRAETRALRSACEPREALLLRRLRWEVALLRRLVGHPSLRRKALLRPRRKATPST